MPMDIKGYHPHGKQYIADFLVCGLCGLQCAMRSFIVLVCVRACVLLHSQFAAAASVQLCARGPTPPCTSHFEIESI